MKKLLGLSWLLPVLIFFSCTQQPKAVFSCTPVAEPSQKIKFDNFSEDAQSYFWEFGDGVTSTERFPVKNYTDTGLYEISLTVYSKNEKRSSTASKTILVGTRHLRKVVLKKFPEKTNTGKNWDDFFEKEPDIYFACARLMSPTYDYLTSVVYNATLDDLPIVWKLDVPLTNEQWDFTFFDEDDTEPQLMTGGYLNPYLQTQPIRYQSEEWEIEYHWVIQ